MPTDPRSEMEALARQLEHWSRAYYVEGRPLVSDLEYDRAYDRLCALEAAHPEAVLPWSPTRRVGSDLTQDLAEVPHSLPVLSLDKAYSAAELAGWMERTRKAAGEDLAFTLEEKLDGVSIVLYYVGGVLDRAVTRGNGERGNLVTENVRTLRSVPLVLPEPVTLAVRGEIFLRKDRFEAYNRTLAEPYANPRNLAAGTLRRVKSAEVAKVPLEIFCYEGFFDPPEPSHQAVRRRLQALGLPVTPDFELLGPDPAGLEARVEAWRARRSALPYEIDGLVLKVDSLAVRDRLGYTEHHPRWAVAFKFDAPQAVTEVLAIDVQVGRSGRITPVARVKPALVGGATITNATLHNQAYIEALDLGVGDQVIISRRGDVIPAVEEVLEKRSPGPWRFPVLCPSCGRALVQDGAHTFCPGGAACPDQARGRLVFFTGKDQMDLAGFGPETLETLSAAGLVRDIPDLFTCDLDQLLDRPGFGPKKVAALKEGRDKARDRSFEIVLASLGLPDLGRRAAALLIEHGVEDWDSLVRRAADRSLVEIPGVGEKTCALWAQALSEPALQELVTRLRSLGLRFHQEPGAREGLHSAVWAGQVWCVTGSFEAFNPRSKAEEELRRRGARVVSAVSGSTTHLLAGTGAGSKLSKARDLGVEVVEEAAFVQRLAEAPL